MVISPTKRRFVAFCDLWEPKGLQKWIEISQNDFAELVKQFLECGEEN
jgi:hypothetical protein